MKIVLSEEPASGPLQCTAGSYFLNFGAPVNSFYYDMKYKILVR